MAAERMQSDPDERGWNMVTLTLLRGLPGSGKSSWARAHVDANTVVVSLDGLREMMAGSRRAWHGTMTPQMNRLLVRQADTLIDGLLAKGVNVISDAQHADPKYCAAEAGIALRHKARVETVTFDEPLDTLLERNRTRPEADRVPEDYLRSQYGSWHGMLVRESRWVTVHVAKTREDGPFYGMDPNGEPMMVDVGLLWNDGDAPDDAAPGVTAVASKTRNMTGRVRLEYRTRKDGKPWTLAGYAAWLEAGAPYDPDGRPVTDTAGKSSLLTLMAANPNVRVRAVKGEPDVYACNFTRDAFRNHCWDEYTSKARGLFLNGNGHVVARGFEKFFNLGENEETSRENVDGRLRFPVRVERKENGFLGLVSMRGDGSWRFWSKSGQTDYSRLIERLFMQAVGEHGSELRGIMRRHDVTLAFEVVDQESDRHIIDYDRSRIVFLHAIANDVDFRIDYGTDKLIDATGIFERPQVLATFQTDGERTRLWAMLEDERLSTREGVVVYGADGYMFKLKTDYYLTVKGLRPMLERALLQGRPTRETDRSERADMARWVLEHADMDKLTYTREMFGDKGVDMEYVGRLLREHRLI